jgi:hypothetical protein
VLNRRNRTREASARRRRKAVILECRGTHVYETPVALPDAGAGKTRWAYVCVYVLAYARSCHDLTPGVVYDFFPGARPVAQREVRARVPQGLRRGERGPSRHRLLRRLVQLEPSTFEPW